MEMLRTNANLFSDFPSLLDGRTPLLFTDTHLQNAFASLSVEKNAERAVHAFSYIKPRLIMPDNPSWATISENFPNTFIRGTSLLHVLEMSVTGILHSDERGVRLSKKLSVAESWAHRHAGFQLGVEGNDPGNDRWKNIYRRFLGMEPEDLPSQILALLRTPVVLELEVPSDRVVERQNIFLTNQVSGADVSLECRNMLAEFGIYL